MAGRPKSEWAKKMEALEKQLPKGFDGRAFKNCRVDGKWDKSKISAAAATEGFSQDVGAIVEFLNHKDDKPASSGKKRGIKKAIEKNQQEIDLLSKKTYKQLSYNHIGKLIAILSEIQKEKKDNELAELKARKEDIEAQIKQIQGK